VRAVRLIDSALPALPIALLALLTAPVIFNTPHLFPDLPAAAAAVWVWVLARDGSASRSGAIVSGLLLALVPWLHFKFLLLWAALLLAALAGRWRRERSRAATIALIAAAGPLSLCTWNLLTFGSFSPTAAAAYPEAIAAVDSPLLAYLSDPLGAIRTGAGLWLDQKDGLLAYAPHLLLAAAGAGWLWRRDRATAAWFAILFGAVWFPTALSQNTGLWGPPGRWLLSVCWIAALLAGVGIFAPSAGPSLRRWRGTLLALTAVVTVLYLRHPSLLYVDRGNTRSPLLQYLGGPGLELWNWLPLWTRVDTPIWGVTFAWTIAFAAAAVWLWRLGSGRSPEITEPSAAPLSGRAFVAATGVSAGALILLATASPIGGPEVFSTQGYGRVQAHVSATPAARAWLHPTTLWFGGSDEITVWISTARPLRWIDLDLLAPAAQAGSVAVGDATEPLAMRAGETRRLRLEPTTTRLWNGRAYTRLVVRTESGISGRELWGGPDARWLGLNVGFADLRMEPPEPAPGRP